MAGLELKGVRKSFGALEVLQSIDIDLPDGGFLVLLGPSGCGKSTLLNIIAGLEPASGGDININGRRVNDVMPKDRNIAMVFQSYALYPTMTVERNMGFGLEMRGADPKAREAAVKAAAELLQVDHLLSRKPSQLSGGQRQRVAMGRAIVREPELFLFDEPLSNLDAKLRVEMRTEIKRLHDKLKSTIVYVTHDQVEAMTLGTLVAVMKDGVLQQCADPQTVYDRPANRYVASFIGSPSMNFLPGVIETTAGGARFAPEGYSGAAIPAVDPAMAGWDGKPVIAGIRPEAFSAATRPNGVQIEALVEVVEPTGPDTMVVARVGETELTARLEARQRPPTGSAITLNVDPADIRFFDPKTDALIA
ncbi:ABC transporter ATP-binding protein [Martelella sp. FOR1707]